MRSEHKWLQAFDVGKPEEKRPLGGPRHEWKNNTGIK
jgi:hypothetical protein